MLYKLAFTISFCINIVLVAIGLKFVMYKGGIKYLRLIFGNMLKYRKIISGSKASSDRVKGFDKYRATENDIIFLGDSITQLGEWSEYFVGMSCRNRGNGGNKTYQLLDMISQIIKGKPKKIFLMIGINDLIGKVKKVETISNYEKILNRFISEIPNTKIYVESILPINNTLANNVYTKNYKTVITITNEDIKKVNRDLEKLCEKFNVKYIDCYSKLINKEGQMPEQYTVDGVHLYQDGYLALANILEKYVIE